NGAWCFCPAEAAGTSMKGGSGKLLGWVAAVDGERRAGDEARLGPGQVAKEAGNLAVLAQAPDGDQRAQERASVFVRVHVRLGLTTKSWWQATRRRRSSKSWRALSWGS